MKVIFAKRCQIVGFQKSTFKNHKPKTPFLISEGDHSKTIKVTKVLCVECGSVTAEKTKLSIKNFFSKCDQIRSFLRIYSHLLNKSLMENFIFVQCVTGIAKEIVMAHNNRYVIVIYMESINDLGHKWIRNILHQIETKLKKLKKVHPESWILFMQLCRSASKFWICFNGNSMIVRYSLQSFYNFK